jgi:hypothetical protein
MRRSIAVCLCLFCLWTLASGAGSRLREVRIGAEGSVEGLVVSLDMFRVILSARGHVKAIEVDVVTGNGRRCELDHNGVWRDGTAEHPKFAKGKLESIGGVPVEYNGAGQVESIGSVAFTYETLDHRPGKLTDAGNFNFQWHDAGNKLVGVNDIRVEYDKDYNYVTRIRSRILALGDWFTKYKVRFVLSVPPEIFAY